MNIVRLSRPGLIIHLNCSCTQRSRFKFLGVRDSRWNCKKLIKRFRAQVAHISTYQQRSTNCYPDAYTLCSGRCSPSLLTSQLAPTPSQVAQRCYSRLETLLSKPQKPHTALVNYVGIPLGYLFGYSPYISTREAMWQDELSTRQHNIYVSRRGILLK